MTDTRNKIHADTSLRIDGYAAVDRNGKIDVHTVSPTERGAMVNWLVTTARILVTNAWSDERISMCFESYVANGEVRLAAVQIVEIRVPMKPKQQEQA
jgi:hypothetical protein